MIDYEVLNIISKLIEIVALIFAGIVMALLFRKWRDTKEQRKAWAKPPYAFLKKFTLPPNTLSRMEFIVIYIFCALGYLLFFLDAWLGHLVRK
jgi:hypothetical protein